jgi:hypothetical protein
MPLPVRAEAIDRVYTLARQAPQVLIFGDRNNNEVATYHVDNDTGDKDNSYYKPTEQEDSSDRDDSNYEPPDSKDSDKDDNSGTNDSSIDPDSGDDKMPQDNKDEGVHSSNNDAQSITQGDTSDNDAAVPDASQDESEPEPKPPDGNQGRQLRRGTRINYSDMSTATHLKTVGYNNLVKGVAAASVAAEYDNMALTIAAYNKPWDNLVTHTILSQSGLKKGLRLFGKSGATAVTKELKQLHNRGVIAPKLASDLTTKQQRRALSYLMFLKEKRNRDIKGRGCADGRSKPEGLHGKGRHILSNRLNSGAHTVLHD